MQDTAHSIGDCCNASITGFAFGNPFVPLSYLEAQASASSATTSSSHGSASSSASTTINNTPATAPPSTGSTTPTSTESSSSSSSHAAAIGAGIGVPVGIARFLGLGFLLYHEHKRRVELESLLEISLPRGRHTPIPPSAAMNYMPQELGLITGVS